uniref:Pyridoxal kinase n=1 Tax=Romanomermis culicivorax TaxID=13658 RepID=A0A915I230_ROMCU
MHENFDYEKRVLSIQSHVVHGYVGNRCSQFTLQAHEYEVDAINSVQFSNHTGYNSWSGEILSEKQLSVLYDGLKENHLNSYTHLLTVCDPVMGDNGSFYVPESLLPIYRDKLVPLADIIAPNQFEVQSLSGVSIKTENQLLEALKILHQRGTKNIVVTSTDLSPKNTSIYVYCSEICQNPGNQRVYRFEIPKYPVTFLGTGDLFASLLLVWLDKKAGDLPASVETVLSCMHGVLEVTYQHAKKHARDAKNLTMADLELRLIHCRKYILEPSFDIKRVKLQVEQS